MPYVTSGDLVHFNILPRCAWGAVADLGHDALLHLIPEGSGILFHNKATVVFTTYLCCQ